MSDTPTPGSSEAVEKGCTCPVIDNRYGRGIRPDRDEFWVMVQCPLHGLHARNRND